MSAENRFINELLELSNILILKGHPKLIIAGINDEHRIVYKHQGDTILIARLLLRQFG